MEGDEVEPLLRPFDRLLLDVADAAHVILVLEHLRLERRPLPGPYRVTGGHVGAGDIRARAEHLEVVLGMTLVELLPGRLPDARIAREENAGPRAVPTGLEGALAAGHVTVTVELPGVLAEVPDVSVAILRVEVVGDLARLATLSDQ